MAEFEKKLYPQDIAKCLCLLAGTKNTEDFKNCEEALYQLLAIAENKYNSDYYRTLWRVLEKITEREEQGDFVAYDC